MQFEFLRLCDIVSKVQKILKENTGIMKRTVAVVTPNGEVVARRVDVPELLENEVLIDVEVSLISPGTEMNLPRARRQTPWGEDVIF